MPPPRAFVPFDPPSPSAVEPPDPYLDFPKESDAYPELSSQGCSPKEGSTRVRQSPSEVSSNAASVNTEIATERWHPFTLIAIGIGLLVGVGFSGIRSVPEVARLANLGAASVPVVTGESTATLTSTPDDSDVYIDGLHAGRTPIRLSLPVGVRVAELRRGHIRSRVVLDMEAGKTTAQHVNFAAEPLTGELEVTSEPLGARVSINGVARGQTPLKLLEVAPGQHRVTISSGRAAVDRTVQITAGAIAAVVVVWKPESTSERPNLREPSQGLVRPTKPPAATNRPIYTALDRDVTPPIELERTIPAWNPPAQYALRSFRGVVQVVVDERGGVESAQLVWPLADFYDARLLEAARGWRFQPALHTGQPVKYRKIVEVTMGAQQ
jgi:hypothetical protein